MHRPVLNGLKEITSTRERVHHGVLRNMRDGDTFPYSKVVKSLNDTSERYAPWCCGALRWLPHTPLGLAGTRPGWGCQIVLSIWHSQQNCSGRTACPSCCILCNQHRERMAHNWFEASCGPPCPSGLSGSARGNHNQLYWFVIGEDANIHLAKPFSHLAYYFWVQVPLSWMYKPSWQHVHYAIIHPQEIVDMPI